MRFNYPRLQSLGILGVFCIAAACRETPPSPAPSTPASQASPPKSQYHLDHAQPKLLTLKLYVKDKQVIAEVARYRQEIATGMMFRESMGTNEGMLFVFPVPQSVGFYMKNVKVPLSVAYMSSDGAIREIHDLQPMNETPVPSQGEDVQFVLEMPQGWFAKNSITAGAVVATERGTLLETFFSPQSDLRVQ